MSEVSPSSPHTTYTNNVIPMPERHPDSYEQIRLAKVSPMRFTKREIEQKPVVNNPHELQSKRFPYDQRARMFKIIQGLRDDDRTLGIACFMFYREQNRRRNGTTFTDILADLDQLNRSNRTIVYGGKEGIAHLARLQTEAEQHATPSAELPPTS